MVKFLFDARPQRQRRMTNVPAGRTARRCSNHGLTWVMAIVLVLVAQGQASAATFSNGDVFASVSNGLVQHYDSAGNLLETLDTTKGGGVFTTGCAVDSAGNLHVTDFNGNDVTKFTGPSDPHTAGSFGSGYGTDPESILFDGVGNVYVGQADGTGDVLKFDAAGNPLASFDVATEDRGSDWIDLAADQCTLFYTSEGSLVKRFDVCTNTQLADFATGLHSPAYALRLLPGGGLLVADSVDIHQLDSGGNIVQTYDAAGEDSWFALNLDPNGTSFWSGDFSSGNFYKFNIASGAIELGPINTGTGTNTLFGLCVAGELTAGNESNCTNATDDDGDGLVDCADPDCALDAACTVDLCANVVCEASDQCHVAGTCDPATGECSDPAADDGTACDDGNACTADACLAGVCTGSDVTPPVVACTVGATALWQPQPPNHNLVNVGLYNSATDACDGTLSFVGVSVFGDEDDEEPTGDGVFSPDAKNIAAGTLRLRDERKGNADGRVYLTVSTATDRSGNTGAACCAVVVPHDLSKASIASVNAQAADAVAYCNANGGAPPPSYFVVGDGPVIGSKQ